MHKLQRMYRMHFRQRSWLSSIWKFAFWYVRAALTFDVYICIYLHLYSTCCILFFLFSLPWPNFCKGQVTIELLVSINPFHCLCLGSDESIWFNCYGKYWEFHQIRFWNKIREAVKNYLADIVRKGGTPLTDNHFSKKPLAERGGTTPSPLTESPPSFSGNFFLKGPKMMFFSLNEVKNGSIRPYNGPKRAKNA